MLEISSGEYVSAFDVGADKIIQSPSYFNNIDTGLIDTKRILLVGGFSGLDSDAFGSKHLIVSSGEVAGPYFANRMVSGSVEVNNGSKNKRKTDYAFSGQVSGFVLFDNLYGNLMGREILGGALKGGSVSGLNFERGKKGGVTDIKAISGPNPWGNMEGGLVIVDGTCNSKSPCDGMTGGIAIVQKFAYKGTSLIGSHEGGTIITSENSLTGNKIIDKKIYEEALVFLGKKSSERLKQFASFVRSITIPLIVEEHNNSVYRSVLESCRNGSEDSFIKVFGERSGNLIKSSDSFSEFSSVSENLSGLYTGDMLRNVLKALKVNLTLLETGGMTPENKPNLGDVDINLDVFSNLIYDKRPLNAVDIYRKDKGSGMVDIDGKTNEDLFEEIFGVSLKK